MAKSVTQMLTEKYSGEVWQSAKHFLELHGKTELQHILRND